MISVTIDERDLRDALKQVDQVRLQYPDGAKTKPIVVMCKSENCETGLMLAFSMEVKPNHEVTIEQLAVR